MGKKVDGKALAGKLLTNIFKYRQQYKDANRGSTLDWCYLAIITVGDDPASQVYVKNKLEAAKRAGITASQYKLEGYVRYQQVESLINSLNENKFCKGIILQLPLPAHLKEYTEELVNLIDPKKDVDGFNNSELFFDGNEHKGLVPCTPKGVMKLIDSEDYDLEGKHVVIINRSNLVGKPLAMMMLYHNATVTVCHSLSKNLEEICKTADVLVSAVGKPHFIKKEFIKPGSFLIDVGISKMDKKIFGDIDPECYEVAGYYTPVPGGVGPMTVAMLMNNFVKAATSI